MSESKTTKIDWDELEETALEVFNTAVRRSKAGNYGVSIQIEASKASAEMLQAIVALRAQRLAEERADNAALPKPVRSVSKP